MDQVEAEFPGLLHAVVVPALAPLQVVHAQAVYRYEQARTGIGKGLRQRIAAQIERMAAMAQLRIDRQWVVAGRQAIAQYVVERGEQRFTARIRRGRRIATRQAPQGQVDAGAGQSRDPAHARIRKCRDAAGGSRRCKSQQPSWPSKDVRMQRFGDVGGANEHLDQQAVGATQVIASDRAHRVSRRCRVVPEPSVGDWSECSNLRIAGPFVVSLSNHGRAYDASAVVRQAHHERISVPGFKRTGRPARRCHRAR